MSWGGTPHQPRYTLFQYQFSGRGSYSGSREKDISHEHFFTSCCWIGLKGHEDLSMNWSSGLRDVQDFPAWHRLLSVSIYFSTQWLETRHQFQPEAWDSPSWWIFFPSIDSALWYVKEKTSSSLPSLLCMGCQCHTVSRHRPRYELVTVDTGPVEF
jgi:hypothetical protein